MSASSAAAVPLVSEAQCAALLDALRSMPVHAARASDASDELAHARFAAGFRSAVDTCYLVAQHAPDAAAALRAAARADDVAPDDAAVLRSVGDMVDDVPMRCLPCAMVAYGQAVLPTMLSAPADAAGAGVSAADPHPSQQVAQAAARSTLGDDDMDLRSFAALPILVHCMCQDTRDTARMLADEVPTEDKPASTRSEMCMRAVLASTVAAAGLRKLLGSE